MLEALNISYEGSSYHDLKAALSDTHGLPRCGELAELRSRSLTRLRVCILDGPEEGNTLRLSGLPELRTLELVGQSLMPLHMHIDAASFAGVRQLHSLCVSHDEALVLEHGSLAPLRALTSLALIDCGLFCVPDDVASSCATLRELCFNDNDQVQIDNDAVAVFLQCSRLNTLELHKEDISQWERTVGFWVHIEDHLDVEQYTPSQWSSDSVTNLVRLSTAFRRRYGRDLDIGC